MLVASKPVWATELRSTPTTRASVASRAVRASPHSRQQRLAVKALGFDFGDSSAVAAPSRAPSPKAFAAFTLRASSLLIYQHVFKGAVGEALMALIAQSQKYQASNKDIVAAYAKFYQLLMLSGYDCWRDYVLDQILLGRDNPFARAVAQGQVEKGAPILQAVAYDLDMLQGLAVSLETLAEYVGEVAPTAGSYWVSAASAIAVKRPSGSAKQLTGDSLPVKPAVVIPESSSSGSSRSDGSPNAAPSAAAAGGGRSSSGAAANGDFIGPPPTTEELAQWKAALDGYNPWSAALPMLQQYYSQHGFGVTSRNSVLRWSKGGFEEASEGGLLAGQSSSCNGSTPSSTLSLPTAAAASNQPQAVLSVMQAAYDQLAQNTLRHCAGLPAEHAVVCGPPGCGKSWLLWEGTLMAGRDAGLRLVDVPASEVANILDIARGCARYPRVHFILVVDHLDLPMRGAGLNDLLAGLSASGGSGWPSNTLLYIGASSTSTVSKTDPLVSRCPLVLPLPGLEDEAAYLQAVQELLLKEASTAAAREKQLQEDAVTDALQWGQQQGYSIRSAAAFARGCRCS